MRKFRFMIAILLIISLSCLLFGCTPERDETQPKNTLPNPTDIVQTTPTGQSELDPAPTAPELSGDPANSQEPAGTVEAPPATETPPEEEDPEIDSGYTFTVEEGIGIGGN